jgi:hypothetical protein
MHIYFTNFRIKEHGHYYHIKFDYFQSFLTNYNEHLLIFYYYF